MIQPCSEFGTILNFQTFVYTSFDLHIMSVNHEFQFMAMLEGHELEKELLSIVSILSLVGFP